MKIRQLIKKLNELIAEDEDIWEYDFIADVVDESTVLIDIDTKNKRVTFEN